MSRYFGSPANSEPLSPEHFKLTVTALSDDVTLGHGRGYSSSGRQALAVTGTEWWTQYQWHSIIADDSDAGHFSSFGGSVSGNVSAVSRLGFDLVDCIIMEKAFNGSRLADSDSEPRQFPMPACGAGPGGTAHITCKVGRPSRAFQREVFQHETFQREVRRRSSRDRSAPVRASLARTRGSGCSLVGCGCR